MFYARMQIDRHLVFKALCVLAEARREAGGGCVRRGMGLRFALAYLYVVARSRDVAVTRYAFDTFWREATGNDAVKGSERNAAWQGKDQMLNSCLNGIARAAGMELDVDMCQAISRAMHPRLRRLPRD
jgi:hypothetical protein